jgi:NADPH:quinone reductase-like Zn-dependent oxidoreductase
VRAWGTPRSVSTSSASGRWTSRSIHGRSGRHLDRRTTSIPLADAAALPIVALTTYRAPFEHDQLTAGQRVLINAGCGAVGDYAIQLARNAGAHVIATASPRSSKRVQAARADEVVNHTRTELGTAITEPVDVVLNLAPIDPAQLASIAKRWRPGLVVAPSVAPSPPRPPPGSLHRLRHPRRRVCPLAGTTRVALGEPLLPA